MFVSNNGFVRDVDLANIATTASFNDLVNVPAGLADGDDNTQLTENQVVTFVSNNGFVRDVDLANIATTASFNDLVNVPAGLADGDDNTQLTENQVVTFVSNNGFVRDVDLANIATTASFNDLVNVPAGLADGDDNTQRAAGSGLALNGNTLSLDTTGCVAGEVLKRNGANDGWECVADVDTDTNTQLTENQVVTFVSNNGFVRDVDLANIATTASFNDLVNVPAGLADGDDNTQRAAGSGLALNGNTLSLDATGCVAGEVLKRNATNDGWECVADVGSDSELTENDVLNIVSQNGYVRDVDLANIATTASFNDLVNVPAGLADGDDNTQRAAGSGLALNGNTLSLDTTGCVAGEVLSATARTMAGSAWRMWTRIRTPSSRKIRWSLLCRTTVLSAMWT